ncbi:hydroxymethylglutaryl-CoA lyase [Fulvivirga sediminis]|uniref:Hydroxymethylglutaryl-CoA lyase n=1 Tax=Fulvivirga sediminis TaxID=2803949 RepID=A0A937FB50_9BACT|nr:hydroxymethylglutaryl-CoA lyase [Fulvivirga sediminis]MBL3657343.1 hydroxymethylglutaryl-CoA lyase [Fulvivirga sediminis]
MKIIECPRDAMQGIKHFIPTSDKVKYLNQLLKVGFDTLDFGSFVSPKAIPQMKDTAEVVEQLDLSQTNTKLLAIVANKRGAETALGFDQIDYLGFPLSISETFQKRNTNKTIKEAITVIGEIQDLVIKRNKETVIYISMGFGNPYGDPYSLEMVADFVDLIYAMGINIISLSDTIGIATPDDIDYLFKNLLAQYPEIEFGAHLHSRPESSRDKIKAAQQAGCRRFDGAINGFGGCPMADDELVGNMATETIISELRKQNPNMGLKIDEFDKSMSLAAPIFGL